VRDAHAVVMAARTRPDPDVVALQPIVIVVATRATSAGEVAHFVGIKSRLTEPFSRVFKHRTVDVLIIRLGLALQAISLQPSAWFKRQVVARQVVRPELERTLQITLPLRQRLARNAKHQIDADVVE